MTLVPGYGRENCILSLSVGRNRRCWTERQMNDYTLSFLFLN